MSSADEIAAAFGKVDEFLLAAGEVAPSVELLLTRAEQQGVTEAAMLRHLRLSSTTARWLLKLEPTAAADRSIDLDEADVGELVLRWARAG
jgi:orotate phosphoribosyltransferase-like protein